MLQLTKYISIKEYLSKRYNVIERNIIAPQSIGGSNTLHFNFWLDKTRPWGIILPHAVIHNERHIPNIVIDKNDWINLCGYSHVNS